MEIPEMNEIIKEQETHYNEIRRILTNMKKDSPTRKNENYIFERRQVLETIIQKANENHSALAEQPAMENKKYMTCQYIDSIMKLFEEAMSHLRQCEERLEILHTIYEPEIPSYTEENDAASPKVFIQMFRTNQIHKKIAQAQVAITEEKPVFHLQTLLQSITKQWQEIEEKHVELLMTESNIRNEYFETHQFERTQDQINFIMEGLQELIHEKLKYQHHKSSAKLPQINIPIFTGTYESWNSFYDLFTKIIHEDQSLSITEKMQYLKTHVRGEAEKLITHLNVNEVNYAAALSLLEKRYKDQRLIVNTYIDKILDLPKITQSNAAALKNLHDTINESLEALKNQEIEVASWGPMLCRIVSRKWDDTTNVKYEDQIDEPNKVQDFAKLMTFLEKRFKSLESAIGGPSSSYGRQNNKIPYCWYCKNNSHGIHYCEAFKSLTSNERFKVVKANYKCINCLLHSSAQNCTSIKTCITCNQKHASLLHHDHGNARNPQQQSPNQSQQKQNSNETPNNNKQNQQKHWKKNKYNNRQNHQEKSANVSATNTDTHKHVLLATAIVTAVSADGTQQVLRVLCDQGSEASFCTEELAQLLSHPRKKIKAEIQGIADEQPKFSNYVMKIILQPRYSSDYKLPVSLIILPKLTNSLPRYNLPELNNNCLNNKIIADPNYYKSGPIDIILGAEEYCQIIKQGFEKIDNEIIAQDTEFGWILSGKCPNNKSKNLKIISMITRTENVELNKFWELEELPTHQNLTAEDEMCENHYQETTIRYPDGTYSVRLPFKVANVQLGESRQKAAARLIQLERKFYKNEKLKNAYHEFMQEYLSMGHMKKVKKSDYKNGQYYIPHQPVIREESLTTKLRVVFDASSETSLKLSLNDQLLKGPRLQQDLSTILLRWRKHKIVFMSDIMKMYRFIKINEQDWKYQRILWRFSPNKPMEEYELTTVTYGTASAPYLAIKTLQKLALDESNNYPLASLITLQDFYVDDILSGAQDVESAKILQTQLIEILNTGGFKLRKWSSNNEELLENIPEENKDDKTLKLPLDETRKSLGVSWSPREDTFLFQITILENENPTKRYIMSEVAKLFDPLGWLAPIIIKMKLLIQELWTNNMEWDQPVDEKIARQWCETQQQLKSIEEIKIPRWCYCLENGEVSLCGFSDSSEKAYGAVIYSRTKVNGKYYITLLQAKSKVAPKKIKATLPRLELCAALLLANLMNKVKSAMQLESVPTYCWTDSMITLGWIRGEASRWQTFVANRVSEIKSVLPDTQWNHVISAENPADIISRGIEPNKLRTFELWWNGPEWLKSEELPFTKPLQLPEVTEEVKRCHHVSIDTKMENNILERFSSMDKTMRVLSYCYRFIKKDKSGLPLQCDELRETTRKIIKIVQENEFKEELKSLKNNQTIRKGSKLSSLDPFVDSDGLLRVGGRLQNSQLPYDQIHPVLLPYKHRITSLIVQDAHQKTLHGGNKLTLAFLRQKYWIIGGKRKVKSLLGKCVKCIRYKAVTASQKMGILPKPRVTQSFPFSHTGVDYAGPIQVRAMKGRGHKSYKSYIAVFVCLATKAIHLELVCDLSSETFIAALRRFMARRGHVDHLYSDNGTNFVGAANFLNQEVLEITQNPDFQSKIAHIGTKWHFIPPASPHFGGIWEAGVKSMKHHLRRVIGDSTLTYEEMNTLLHQIEACLNSRPLCAQSEDINDSIILTPSHFLIGREAVGVPDPIQNINTDFQNKWKQIQKMKKDFWKSWTKDYLHQLQQRYKWKTNQENVKVGTAVLIKDENINPSRWPMAKIKEVHSGSDGIARVVTLQRSNGSSMKRSVHTLIPLPINECDDDVMLRTVPTTPVQANMITTQHRAKKAKSNGVSNKFSWLLFLTMIIQLFATVASNYTMRTIEPGIYVEELGISYIDRGTFRVEVHYEKLQIEQSRQDINSVMKQFEKLCQETSALNSEAHCNQFHQHLQEEQKKFEKTREYLSRINIKRRRRGLLGQFLTSVFGVNDEVYKDIESLNKNQKELIEAANHQKYRSSSF